MTHRSFTAASIIAVLIGSALLLTHLTPSADAQAGKAKAKRKAALSLNGASWVWLGKAAPDNDSGVMTKSFTVAGPIKSARVTGSCDNHMQVKLNGQTVLSSGAWERPVNANVTKQVKTGDNTIAATVRNDSGPAGFIFKLEVTLADGKTQVVQSDASWQVAAKGTEQARQVHVVAKYGGGPWGTLPKRPIGGDPTVFTAATVKDAINVPKGFEVELLYTVPKNTQGSWVAITALPDGRLVASDQGNKGLYYITPGKSADDTKVAKVPVNVSNAQGLLWAFDSLYANRNGGGLWRITDSNKDGELDHAEAIVPLKGGGEHGPHAVILTEDKKGLYIVGGNHTDIPPDLTGSRQPRNWGEDLLLPRQWDARGHARGKLAPGGWVARVSPDGKERVLYSNGFRNQYDIALNNHGDMFTFDSDMEWDFGTPWYRPTRVNHVTSGSEFGWRSGTGKWPAYYPDSLPAVVDIGPASPVGVLFGYGAKFPDKWHEALYVLDWTYGTIWAVHLKPNGSTYSGKVEEFVSGKPLPVTDATVGTDGAFYFTVGGRGTQSALYRVTYSGSVDLDAIGVVGSSTADKLRKIRRTLEEYHGVKHAGAVPNAWQHLGHGDRFIRYAARIAVESQPVNTWRAKALSETDPQALITAMVALARQGKSTDLNDALNALNRLELTELSEQQLLEALRAYQLVFIRLGKPNRAQQTQVVHKLDAIYPNESDDANAELVNLLVYLDAPTVVDKTMKLLANLKPTPKPKWATVLDRNNRYGGTAQKMLANMPPLRGIHYAFALRNVRFGWTIPQREQYFAFINSAAKHPGGASYAGFLNNIRKEALANASASERAAVKHLTGENLTPPPPFKVKPVTGPGEKWTVASASNAVGNSLKGRSFENGRNAFYATGCVKCHRFDGAGGAIGPDLSSVGNKFSHRDLLEAIIEPNKVISDQYQSHILETKDGDRYIGIVIENKDNGTVDIYTKDFDTKPITVKASEVDSKKPSPISQMPANLLDPLNKDEMLDLLAYLLSRGDSNAAYFK